MEEPEESQQDVGDPESDLLSCPASGMSLFKVRSLGWFTRAEKLACHGHAAELVTIGCCVAAQKKMTRYQPLSTKWLITTNLLLVNFTLLTCKSESCLHSFLDD